MNLLLVNYEYPPVGGGAANATQFLGAALARAGHQVHVLTSGLQRAEGTSEEDGVIVHRLPIRRARADRATQTEMARFLAQSVRAVLGLNRTHRFGASIAFFTIPSGPAALRLHRATGIPYAVSLRGGDVPGHVPGIGWMHWLTRPLRRAVLRNACAIVANSESLAATSREADAFPVSIIANGVDSQRFHPRGERRGSERLRVLFVGRLHPEKNLCSVISQLPFLDSIELQVAGDGSQRAELAALAERLGVSNRVHWLGWQSKDALPELYRNADALVNPSFYEGMPNVVLEAMATALPVVASDVPGNRSVVENDKTGLLFPLGSAHHLRQALDALASDRGRAVRLGAAGRARAVVDFSWDTAATRYLDLLTTAPPR